MSIFKSTPHIWSRAWEPSKTQDMVRTSMLPQTDKWASEKEIQYKDVELWEEIHHEAGNFGVFVAYRPYADFFIIAHYMLANTKYAFEIYRDEESVRRRTKELGLGLTEKQVYVP